MVKLSCKTCGVGYEVADYRKLLSKYCSRSCHGKVAGKVGGKAGKGVTRNKGLKRPDLGARNKVVKVQGERHLLWKGDEVGYVALNTWISRTFGKATKCEFCFSLNHVQWANKTKHYKRQREDWQQLCASCHKKYDNNIKNIVGRFKNHKLNPAYNGYSSVQKDLANSQLQ